MGAGLVYFLARVSVRLPRTSHHHVHTALAAAVCGDVALGGECLLRPACGWYLVDRQVEVLRARESRRAACQEQEARVGGLEQERHKGGCHDLGADSVDVPGRVPCLAHRQATSEELLIKLSA